MKALALRGLVRKELLQIRADRRMIALLTVAPLLQLVVFSYAANLDAATARVVVVDRDRTPESRALSGLVAVTDTLELLGSEPEAAGAESLLQAGKAELVLVIPAGHGAALARGEPAEVGLTVDGSDATLAGISMSAASGLVAHSAARLAAERRAVLGPDAPPLPGRLLVRPRVLYNPELRSRLFLVPGVLGMVLMIVTMIATSMAVVREKELGTLEQLQVTPVDRATILAGKLIPFAAIGFADSLVVLGVARFWFGVPLEGSAWMLLGNVPGFLLCTLGLGLLVSTVSRTQQQAMMTAMFFVMLPMIYLSGFVFAIESMPRVVQPFTEAIPLTHFLTLVRGVMLKGAGLPELWPAVLKLWLLGFGIFALAVARFRKRLA